MDNDIPEINELIQQFSKLPGLGPKSAKRIILKLINNKDNMVKPLAKSLAQVYQKVVRCIDCGNLKIIDKVCICSSDNAYYWGHTQGADNIVSLSIEITASDDAPLGHTSISGLVIGSLNSNYAHVYPLAITLGLIVEDFEAGNFSSYDWMHGGDADWVIHTDSYSGSFSAMSGEIGHSQNSELSIEMNILHSGELKFWAKASSEEGSNVYDYLDLYINNQPQDLIIGGDLNWTEYSVVLPEGSHTLQWIYSKDDATSIGDDCVWIDRIQFPPGSVPPLNINFGDVNSDDIVNILDVIVSVNYIIGYIEFDNQQLQNADMNLDGSISVSDILMIVESVLGD